MEEDHKSTSQQELQVIDDKIIKHEAKVAALQAALDVLSHDRRKLDGERNAALPISKIPLEVMTEIFLLVCESALFPLKPDLPGPYVIGRVCRAWREVVWSVPQFWTDISLSFSPTRHIVQKMLLQQWLNRTADLKLHVNVRLPVAKIAKKSKLEPPAEIFEALLESCHRWEHLQLVAFDNFFKALKKIPHRRFCSLKSLAIQRTPAQTPRPPADWSLELDHPLDELELGSGFVKRNVVINWAHLRKLDVILPLSDCVAILQQCARLETCNLIVNQFPISGLPVDIPLQHLTSATISGYENVLAALIRALRTPSLTSLRLEPICVLEDHGWLAALTKMAEKSPLPLTAISIVEERHGGEGTSEEELLALLERLPTIQTLDLRLDTPFVLSNTTIDHLCLFPDGNTETGQNQFLPNLRGFEFAGLVSFDLGNLLGLLKTRATTSKQRYQGHATEMTTKPRSKFLMEITYENDDWFTEQSPNEVHDFYKSLESVTRGRCGSSL